MQAAVSDWRLAISRYRFPIHTKPQLFTKALYEFSACAALHWVPARRVARSVRVS